MNKSTNEYWDRFVTVIQKTDTRDKFKKMKRIVLILEKIVRKYHQQA